MKDDEKGPTDMQTLMRGEVIEVTLVDFEKHSQVEQVKVKQLPYATFDTGGGFIDAINRGLVPTIMLYTGKDAAWVESLSQKSFDKILELGRQLNFPTFELCNKHRKGHAQWLSDMTAAMQNEIAKLIAPFLNVLQSSQLQQDANSTSGTGKKSRSRKSK